VNYEPAQTPSDDKYVREFLARELRRLASIVRDDSPTVWYRTEPVVASLSAGVSANWKCPAGNVLLLSTSNTITLTGIAEKTPFRERALINIGTGVVVLKSQASESSASNRFALPIDWQLSANASALIWRDPFSARHRGLSRT
jgi:hypothetical protein